MNELSALIRAEILRLGSIPFERFMDLALYHPHHGYYRRAWDKPRIGRGGDFFSSVSVGPLFGRLLARQFLEMWQQLERPPEFWMIEQGGEDAQLACDVLAWCLAEAPDFFAAIRYGLIESDSPNRGRQKMKLETVGLGEKVGWFHADEACADEKSAGVFFSNELVDSLPVHLVTRRKEAWLELHVVRGRDQDFAWMKKPIESRELAAALTELPLPALEGYTTEINLRARAWMKNTARIFRRGYFLTIDYGFPAAVYYAPFRANGTLTAYLEHQQSADVLLDPGSRDITAHVDFTALARAGERAGLATVGFLDQQHFLMGIAHEELSEVAVPRVGLAENPRAWQTLTNPSFLGARFQVLVQAKDAPRELAGLRYARASELDFVIEQ